MVPTYTRGSSYVVAMHAVSIYLVRSTVCESHLHVAWHAVVRGQEQCGLATAADRDEVRNVEDLPIRLVEFKTSG